MKDILKKKTKKLVIYLMSYPFTNRDYDRLGIKIWIRYNWQVKIFNVSSFINKKLYQYINADIKNLYFKNLTNFKNINQILTAINKLPENVVFIDILGNSTVEKNIRNFAQEHGVTILLNLGFFPLPRIENNFLKKIILLISNPKKFFNKLIDFMINKKNNFMIKNYCPNYIVIGGNKSLINAKHKKSKIIKAHNFDYDFIVQEKKNKKIEKKYKNKYLVFLDDYGPYHPDKIVFNRKPFITPNRYYSVIDNGLNKIAKTLNLKIKIAAHPKSNYIDKKIKYNQKIIKNKTFELIKNSSLVIGHASTSLQLAVIMEKPIILASTDEILNESYSRYFSRTIASFAEELDKEVINFSNSKDFHNLKKYLSVNKKIYKKYVENYVKTRGSSENFIWEIVIKKIERDISK